MYSNNVTKRYSIAEARASLPTLIDEVQAGNEVELTRRGKPVAVVVSRDAYDRLQSAHVRFRDAYAAFRARFDLADLAGEPDAFANVRDDSRGRAVDL
jgi:prevent-host-death family protein